MNGKHLFLALLIVLGAFAYYSYVAVDTNEANETKDSIGLPDGAIRCSPESRNAEMCITLYKPVCGWNDPEKIQCIRYPCASTYSNSCVACQNENVPYYTEGECPQ